MSDTADRPLNLRQKLIQIYSKIDHVEKAGNNTKQNYRFVRSADMLRALRTAFAELGIYAETNFELLGTYDIKTNNGGVMHTATVKATIVLFDGDSEETKTISGLGDGADPGDKGIFKAQTGAVKNALRNGALIPDEADPEADERVDGAVEETPDFQDTRHPANRQAPSRPATAQEQRPTEAAAKAEHVPSHTAASSTNSQASTVTATPTVPQSTTLAAPAAAEEPLNEKELDEYRKRFRKLGDELSTDGKLKASKGLPLNRKLLVFLLSVTKAEKATVITKAQWETFFKRVEASKNSDTGLVGLAAKVNEANGITDKK